MRNARTNNVGNDTGPADAPDALALLKADHRAVKAMFAEYARLRAADEGDEQAKQELANRICLTLMVHAEIEEDIFYPALRETVDDQAVLDDAEVEHASTDSLIDQIREMEAGDDLYDARVTVLGQYIQHHVAEEEGVIFDQARHADIDLRGLGEELQARAGELKAEMGLDDDGDGPGDERDGNTAEPARNNQSRSGGPRRAA